MSSRETVVVSVAESFGGDQSPKYSGATVGVSIAYAPQTICGFITICRNGFTNGYLRMSSVLVHSVSVVIH